MKKAFEIVKDVLKQLQSDRVDAYVAQSAFFLFLSVVPFIIFMVTIVRFTPLTYNSLISYINNSLPEYIVPFFDSVADELYKGSISTMTVSIISALWASGKGIQSIMNGLNNIYGVEKRRNFFVLRLKSVLYMTFFTAFIIFGILFVMYGKKIRKELFKGFSAPVVFASKVIDYRYLILFLLLTVLFIVTLKFLPGRKRRFKYVLLPAVLAAFLWTVLSFGISVYVTYFGGFSMYGSMMTLMLLLMWMYFGMYILFLAAELDSMYSEKIFIEIKKRKILRQKKNTK